MSFAVIGNPTCPACQETIATKAMAFSCGSCGHRIEPVRRCFSGRSVAVSVGLMLFVLGLSVVAHWESSRLQDKVRANLAARVRTLSARNSELTRQLARSREALRAVEARERCALSRIELLRDHLAMLATDRECARQQDELDELLSKMVRQLDEKGTGADADRQLDEALKQTAREGLEVKGK